MYRLVTYDGYNFGHSFDLFHYGPSFKRCGSIVFKDFEC